MLESTQYPHDITSHVNLHHLLASQEFSPFHTSQAFKLYHVMITTGEVFFLLLFCFLVELGFDSGLHAYKARCSTA
jgi:hypothetical protein